MTGRYTDPLFVAAVLCGRAWPACGTLSIVGESGQLNELDERLWHEPNGRFLPHSRVQANESSSLADSAILLSEQAPAACDLLINLQPDGPLPEGDYTRILEIVPQDESLKQALRTRWKNWKQRGAELHHHKLK